jgi:hypothetical protein
MAGGKTKFIFVTGGVVSSLGKGLASASIGALMEGRGLSVTHLKMDPYINVDPGTMSPFQHGEVFVTDDGAETDLDLGHYERYVSTPMGKKNNFTTGQVYDTVIPKNGAATISAERSRSFPILPTRFNGAFASPRKATTSRSARWEERSATSKAYRFWKRSGSSAGKRARKTFSTFISRWCRTSPPAAS